MKKIVLVLLAIMLLTGCKEKTKTNTLPIIIEEEGEVTKSDVKINDYYSYVETINIEDSGEEENFTVYKNIYLLEDNKYYYEFTEYGDTCGVWSSGTYTLNEDKLELTETYNGDCTKCYYTVNLNNYSFTVLEDQLLSSDGETLIKTEKAEKPNIDLTNYNNCDKNVE